MWENGELVYVVVGSQEAYLCSPEYAFNWLDSGFWLYGAADSVEEAQWLYHDALGEWE